MLSAFSNEYGQAINLFIKKIEALPTDGDVVKFLNNPSILDIKKDLEYGINNYKRVAIITKNDLETNDLFNKLKLQ